MSFINNREEDTIPNLRNSLPTGICTVISSMLGNVQEGTVQYVQSRIGNVSTERLHKLLPSELTKTKTCSSALFNTTRTA